MLNPEKSKTPYNHTWPWFQQAENPSRELNFVISRSSIVSAHMRHAFSGPEKPEKETDYDENVVVVVFG